MIPLPKSCSGVVGVLVEQSGLAGPSETDVSDNIQAYIHPGERLFGAHNQRHIRALEAQNNA